MNTAYLNLNNLKLQEVKTKISRAIDDLMISHRNHKGIIHTTSYKQLNFIKENISQVNKRRWRQIQSYQEMKLFQNMQIV
jgi:hypothetical protein